MTDRLARLSAAEAAELAIDRFCRDHCPVGPAEAECLDCILFPFRRLDRKQRDRLYGPINEEE